MEKTKRLEIYSTTKKKNYELQKVLLTQNLSPHEDLNIALIDEKGLFMMTNNFQPARFVNNHSVKNI